MWVRAKGQHYRTLRSDGGRLSGIVIDISDQKSADERVDTATGARGGTSMRTVRVRGGTGAGAVGGTGTAGATGTGSASPWIDAAMWTGPGSG